jgi:hypothetical protein
MVGCTALEGEVGVVLEKLSVFWYFLFLLHQLQGASQSRLVPSSSASRNAFIH